MHRPAAIKALLLAVNAAIVIFLILRRLLASSVLTSNA